MMFSIHVKSTKLAQTKRIGESMKITKLIATFCLFVPSLAFAQAPAWMPVQAYLADAEGVPLTGEHDISLTLYDADSQVLFNETQTVLLDEGLVTLYLGTNQTLDLALFAGNQEISLGIAVDADPEMSPRFTLGTVPFSAFAQHAAGAATLGEYSAEDFLLAVDDADTLAALSCADGQVPKASVTGWVCAEDINTDSGGDITGVNPGTGLVGGGSSGDVTLSADLAGTGAATSVARSDHNHDLAYSSLTHNHTIADLPVGTTADTVAAGDHAHSEYLAETGGSITGDIDVTGQVIAQNTWTRIGSATLTNAGDHTFNNLDGNAYRRFRVELEGILAVGGTDRVIGLRPNSSVNNYGPYAMHWNGHMSGVAFSDTTGITGTPASLLPLCVTHYNVDGHLFCTGEMNTRSGRYRMIHSSSTFASSGACGSSSCIITTQAMNSWRDSSANITSLVMHFGGATLFDGEVTLWALK